jgi:type III restriction enzyme
MRTSGWPGVAPESYALNEETKMFAEETAKVFGVPFELIPFKVSPPA